ncbi:MAG: acyl-CoA dehydrogenase family protein [Sphingomonadales bacterium]
MIFTEEQNLIQDMARNFANDRLQPNSAQWEKTGEYPQEIIDEMGELGLFGMTVSEEWGGSDAGFTAFALATMEIARGDGGLSTIMSVTSSLVCGIIQKLGTKEQKETYLPSLACGESMGAFCLTEAQAGSDAAMIKTYATKVESRYKLNGTKQMITSGRIGKTAIVFAITKPGAGKKGLSAFIVPMNKPGFLISKTEEKMGQKASDCCQINFDDVELDGSHLIGQEGDGYKIALQNLESGRIGIAAQSVGMAQAAYDYALQYAKERITFGKPIFEHQAVGFRLAEMATNLEAARQLVLNAAHLKDQSVPCLKEACMAKLFASEMAEKVCSDAIQTLGGYGYLSEYPVEKIARDVRVCQLYEGTSDIQKIVISRAL